MNAQSTNVNPNVTREHRHIIKSMSVPVRFSTRFECHCYLLSCHLVSPGDLGVTNGKCVRDHPIDTYLTHLSLGQHLGFIHKFLHQVEVNRIST